jgi:lipopolysaccharide/colanic/teichoic acid biosynthesis glycosyltransferase
MITHHNANHSRKDVMRKSSFLTYRQGLSLTIPGSSQTTVRSPWTYQANGIQRARRAVLDFGATLEYAFRDLILSNAIVLVFLVYTATALRFQSVASTAWLGSAAKRTVDVVSSFLGLIALMPLFLLVAIAIKLDSEGPVFFAQLRVGKNRRREDRNSGDRSARIVRRGRERRRQNTYGQPFYVLKFRSMVHHAEKRSGPIWATRDDPRVTRVGAILRKTRIDELPQLVNVLLGNMSLVGPRPERPVFVESLSNDIEEYRGRLNIKPGITGLAQVIGGYDTSVSSVRAKVKHDLHYIRHWSLAQDLKILVRTVLVVVTGKGAF